MWSHFQESYGFSSDMQNVAVPLILKNWALVWMYWERVAEAIWQLRDSYFVFKRRIIPKHTLWKQNLYMSLNDFKSTRHPWRCDITCSVSLRRSPHKVEPQKHSEHIKAFSMCFTLHHGSSLITTLFSVTMFTFQEHPLNHISTGIIASILYKC